MIIQMKGCFHLQKKKKENNEGNGYQDTSYE